MDYRKYLLETTISGNYPDDGTGVAGDDDAVPGNILMGNRYVRTNYNNRLTDYDTIWDIDNSNYDWSIFKYGKGQDDPDNYHSTLKGLKTILGDRLMKHIKTKPFPDTEVKRTNIKNKRPEMEPKNAIGNDPNVKQIIDPEKDNTVINKIDRFLK